MDTAGLAVAAQLDAQGALTATTTTTTTAAGTTATTSANSTASSGSPGSAAGDGGFGIRHLDPGLALVKGRLVPAWPLPEHRVWCLPSGSAPSSWPAVHSFAEDFVTGAPTGERRPPVAELKSTSTVPRAGNVMTTLQQPYGQQPYGQQPYGQVPQPANPTNPPVATGGPAPAGLTATNVSAWFGSNKVLERVTLSMEPGKVTALIGPSGCGKSTFLRILNRMHELIPTAALSGSVELDGVNIYGPTVRVTETRLGIGMVFQRPNPFPTMTIAQNVLAGLRLSGNKVRNPDALVEGLPGARRAVEGDPQPTERGWSCALRRPTAAPVHRQGVGRPAQGAADGRAVLSAGSHLHRRDRGDDP